ncbi:acetoacetyl-CoA synthetase [Nephila pilipes]|uniref:Acetoacetyl-CoA synthetase n=1 Tax=Nephila pilipes TaxID=299642 RepID=A0A8X6I8J7_NEPPI|nr:acetoacetyl-CoA synthetase [Nephila pilipes]
MRPIRISGPSDEDDTPEPANLLLLPPESTPQWHMCSFKVKAMYDFTALKLRLTADEPAKWQPALGNVCLPSTPLHGEIGEILITKPIPNLPIGLWGDKDGTTYREKYFSKHPGKFTMSDFGVINPFTKGLTICCRSDETLKQRGTRFGSSEIYNIVDLFPEVRDSLCVAYYNESMDESAVLFLKIREGYSFSDKLVKRIRDAITRELTECHVPDIILQIQDIPYNINGKKVEIIVKKIINKMPYNSETVRNPEALKYYYDIPELQ